MWWALVAGLGLAEEGRTVTVYFATNREWVDDELRSGFNARDAEKLTWGSVEVAENGSRLMGELKWLDPAVPQRMAPELTLNRIAEPALPVVMLVHGYNTTWSFAVKEAAQLALDLQDQGTQVVPVLYSWPSGGLIRYTADENSASRSISRFTTVLDDVVEKVPDGNVHLVAHSMGARVVSAAIHELWQREADQPEHHLGNIVLAIQKAGGFTRADIDALEFQERYLLNVLASGARTTLYVTENDRALSLSERLHGGYQRLGQAGMGQAHDRLEVIDTGPLDHGATRHSTFRESPEALGDLARVLRGESCDSRGLVSAESGWTFKAPPPREKARAPREPPPSARTGAPAP